MNILVIDDERTLDVMGHLSLGNMEAIMEITEFKSPNDVGWNRVFHARNLFQARDCFYSQYPGYFDVIYLDHDLGNGEDVREFTREIERDAHDGILYEVGKFVIHSMNPLGRKEMYEALHKFYNVEFARVEDLI